MCHNFKVLGITDRNAHTFSNTFQAVIVLTRLIPPGSRNFIMLVFFFISVCEALENVQMIALVNAHGDITDNHLKSLSFTLSLPYIKV